MLRTMVEVVELLLDRRPRWRWPLFWLPRRRRW